MLRIHGVHVGTNILRTKPSGKEGRVRGYPNVALAQAAEPDGQETKL